MLEALKSNGSSDATGPLSDGSTAKDSQIGQLLGSLPCHVAAVHYEAELGCLPTSFHLAR